MVRPEPKVIRIIPPPESLRDYMPHGIFALVATVLIAWVFVEMASTYATAVPLLTFVGLCAAITISVLRHWRASVQRHRQIVADWERSDTGSIAEDFARLWKPQDGGVNPVRLSQVAAKIPSIGRAQATVISYGVGGIPRRGDYRFEPLIITPGDRTEFWTMALLAYAVVTLGAVALGLWPLPIGPSVYPVGAAILIALGFIWNRHLRPTYLRIAPGMLQVLQFATWRGRLPEIRSYPIEAGTIVVFDRRREASPTVVVYLLRNGLIDTIHLTNRRLREEALERIWQAIMTTAPTPPLSEEELVG